jgi:hydrogenase small subunit
MNNHSKKLYWLQAGGCSGDSMSVLNMDSPDFFSQLTSLGIDLLWHPSLSTISPLEHDTLLNDILSDRISLDIFCLEGNVVMGPDGSGLFDTFRGEAKKDLIAKLTKKARYIVAVGTCASFGGFGSHEGDELGGIGLTQLHGQKGGFLGEDFTTQNGSKVINLPGCPIHPKALEFVLYMISHGLEIELDENATPISYYGHTVHQGCTRNEHHEYRVEEEVFGEEGCMFFHLGCKGPTTHASCNKHLWNDVNSKTRAGVPCFGCTNVNFPHATSFFETPNIAGTPQFLPEGVDRAYYLAYKDMAAAAAPERLKRKIEGIQWVKKQ